jgi:hypothetical protein
VEESRWGIFLVAFCDRHGPVNGRCPHCQGQLDPLDDYNVVCPKVISQGGRSYRLVVLIFIISPLIPLNQAEVPVQIVFVPGESDETAGVSAEMTIRSTHEFIPYRIRGNGRGEG